MENITNKSRNSIAKVWFIILVLGLTYAALAYWAVESYKVSERSVENMIRPNPEASQLNRLYNKMIQSDLHFNNFILTNDSLQLHNSLKASRAVDSMLAVLRSSSNGVFIDDTNRLDSIQSILRQKSMINGYFIELKQKGSSFYFSEQALRRIQRQLSDSAYIDHAVVNRAELFSKVDTIKHINIVQRPDEYKGLGGFFRKLFGQERMATDTLITRKADIKQWIEYSVDSSIVRNYFIDTTLVVVKTILADLLNEEIRQQRVLNMAELDLIQVNEQLLSTMQHLLDEIAVRNAAKEMNIRERSLSQIEHSNLHFLKIAGLGMLTGLVLLLIVVYDLRRINVYRAQLEHEMARAEALAASKEDFLYIMSHEIRTPLHTITGFTDLLKKELQNKKQLELIHGVIYANDYLNELLVNILEHARISSGSFKSEKSDTSLVQICEELALLFALRKEEQNCRFEISYDPWLETQCVHTDGLKLKQALVNLLSNAFKNTKNGIIQLEIYVEHHLSPTSITITVSDTGSGIPEMWRENIFEPFQTMKTSSGNDLGGTGLGLSITRHIIEELGGEISVESEVGVGSKFTISLTLTSSPTARIDERPADQEYKHAYFDIRVLAVEDDPWNAMLLERYIGANVALLHICPSAEEAIETIAAKPMTFNLILTDVNLPDMNGITFFEIIRESTNLPVIGLTASLTEQSHKQMLEIGFTATLGKPFSQNQLVSLISELFPDVSHQSAQMMPHSNLNQLADIDIAAEFMRPELASYIIEKINLFIQSSENGMDQVQRLSHQLRSNLEQLGIGYLSEQLQSIEFLLELNEMEKATKSAKAITPELRRIRKSLESDAAANHASIP